jgi:hypothetical protein
LYSRIANRFEIDDLGESLGRKKKYIQSGDVGREEATTNKRAA